MPGALDSCVNNVYQDGNIPASSGTTPSRVLLKHPIEVAILEAATAADVLDGDAGVFIVETASAADVLDGALVSYATWDAATVASVSLSGGNLVATNTGTTSTTQGAQVASTAGKTSGKYYFEVAFTTITTAGTRLGVGVGTTASTYNGMSQNATSGGYLTIVGLVHANGVTNIVDLIAGSFSAGTVIAIAVDLDNETIWFRQAPSGNWNASGTANPATNTEGITIPSGTMVPFCCFGGTAGAAGNVITANFGASAFTGTVPSGFTGGWTT